MTNKGTGKIGAQETPSESKKKKKSSHSNKNMCEYKCGSKENRRRKKENEIMGKEFLF